MSWSSPRTYALLATLAGTACQSEPSPRPRHPTRPRPDKAFLYADPGLVPSRDGERARAELALTGELEAAIRVLPGVLEVRATLSLTGSGTVERGLVLVRHREDAHPDLLRARVETIETAILPEGPVTLMLEATATTHDDPELPADGRALGLAIAFLGLGLSVGISAERLRRLRRGA